MSLLRRLIGLTEETLEEVRDFTPRQERQAWQQDYEDADIANFAEQCLPPEQRPKTSLPHNLIKGD